MERPLVSSEAEKERLRGSIARQVEQFLNSGGSITVLETPQRVEQSPRGSIWHAPLDISPTLD